MEVWLRVPAFVVFPVVEHLWKLKLCLHCVAFNSREDFMCNLGIIVLTIIKPL